MKIFQVNKKIEVVCQYKDTRNGFKHEATLLINGNEVDKAKCCYQNRTWESYKYESVLRTLLDKTKVLSEAQKKEFKYYIEHQREIESKEVSKKFSNISNVMALGNLFGKDQKEKNDWKTRMLKAGLENKGLIMPDDWNDLSESVKEERLNIIAKRLKSL